MKITIDLSLFKMAVNGSGTGFIGKSDGKVASKLYVADEHDTIHISVPPHIRVVTPTFYIGLLEKHVELFEYRTFEELKECYTLTCSHSMVSMNFLTYLRRIAIKPLEPPKGFIQKFRAWLYGPAWRILR